MIAMLAVVVSSSGMGGARGDRYIFLFTLSSSHRVALYTSDPEVDKFIIMI